MAKGRLNRKYTLADRQGAFRLYLKGMNTRDVAKEMNKQGSFDPPMAHTTVDRWSKKYGWDEERSDRHARISSAPAIEMISPPHPIPPYGRP